MENNDIKIAIVFARFNETIVNSLFKGAIREFSNHGINADEIKVVRVPGAFEIPVAVKALIDKGKYDVIITLGAVIRGETPHFEYISSACARGISKLAIESGIPIIFGVLTVNNMDEALSRSDPEGDKNKGGEAVEAAISTYKAINK